MILPLPSVPKSRDILNVFLLGKDSNHASAKRTTDRAKNIKKSSGAKSVGISDGKNHCTATVASKLCLTRQKISSHSIAVRRNEGITSLFHVFNLSNG